MFRTGQGERGFALPLALVGLLLVSVLIVGTLMTATSESALSYAHQDATRSLYTAAGALEAYVAEAGLALAPVSLEYTPPAGGAAVFIDVERIARVPTPFPNVDKSFYSVRAEPVGGGRAVSAMISIGPFDLGIESAATFGGDARIGGSTILSDGRDSESCDLAPAEHAVVHADSTTVDTIGSRVSIVGTVKESELTNDQLIRKTLGGYSIEELAQHIQDQELDPALISRFGTNAIWGPYQAFSGNTNRPRSWDRSGGNDVVRTSTNLYNWYCPGEMDRPDSGTRTACPDVVGIDTTTYRMVLVDAGGTEITIQGDHGQGLLLVLNGGVNISGGFIFRGLIVSTHDIDIYGTGNKVDGAIVSQNEVRVDRESDTDSEVSGNAVVTFNRCALNAVAQAIGGDGSDLQLSRFLAWNELVR